MTRSRVERQPGSRRAVILRLAASIGLLTVLIAVVPWAEVREAASRLSASIYFGAVAAFLAGHCLGAVKWRLMLTASRSGSLLGMRDTLSCYGAGLFSNLFLPSVVGGDLVRATLAARALGRPEAVVLGSIADRLIDLASLALLAAGGVAVAGTSVTGWVRTVLVVAALVTVLAVGLFSPLALRRPLERWPVALRRRVGRGLVALRHLARHPGPAVLAFALSMVMQGAFILVSAWLGRVVGAQASLGVWFVVWPVAKLVAMLPMSVGGLGVRDAALTSLLIPFGVPAALGLVASLAWNAVLVGGALLAGLFAWVVPIGGARGRRGRLVGRGLRETEARRTSPATPGA